MATDPIQHDTQPHEEFSLPLMAVTVVGTLAALATAVRFLTPDIWSAQILAPIWKGVAVFLMISFVNCYVEYFFHRYVLHTPWVPIISRLYKQHTLHHALTRIGRRQGRDGRGIYVVENKFPIVEPEQGEASFFPWYTLAVFSLFFTPALLLAQRLFPSFPWLFGGYTALASSLVLYEVLHAINHWPFEKWEPLIQHPRWGKIWRPAYAFHLRHHAVIDCNESISGFFGLPLADWTFGTCLMPKTIYSDGDEAMQDEFLSPKPRWFVRKLDQWSAAAVQQRRTRPSMEKGEADGAHDAVYASMGRHFTRGEEIANWITHGIGLAASVVGLTLLIVFSSLHGNGWHVVSFTVFGLTLLTLYTVSTIYHAQGHGKVKSFFKKLDHAAVFLLIAGTYTPFLIANLRGSLGWTLFGVIWGLCGAGAVFQVFFGERYKVTSTLAFLFLGWLTVVALESVVMNIPVGGMWLLLAGGACYLLGAAFYRWHKLRYHHAVWHTFVLGGTTCHFLAVILFLLPRAAG